MIKTVEEGFKIFEAEVRRYKKIRECFIAKYGPSPVHSREISTEDEDMIGTARVRAVAMADVLDLDRDKLMRYLDSKKNN